MSEQKTPRGLLTADALAEIQRRCDSAAIGEWKVTTNDDTKPWRHIYCRVELTIAPEFSIQVTPTTVGDISTAEFIAHARTDIPALLAHVAAMQAELDGSRAAVGCVNDMLTVLNERATRLREEAVEAFRQRAVEAVIEGEDGLGGDWEAKKVAELLQQLPATTTEGGE